MITLGPGIGWSVVDSVRDHCRKTTVLRIFVVRLGRGRQEIDRSGILVDGKIDTHAECAQLAPGSMKMTGEARTIDVSGCRKMRDT